MAVTFGSAVAFGAEAAPQRAVACLKVPNGLLVSLKDGLRAKARGKVGTPKAVKSNSQFSGPRDIREGPVYFVSAPVRGFGVATWAVGGQAFRNGGGIIIAVGPVARRVSTAGVDIPTSTLKAWGLTSAANGYAQSRACL
jgi:hypothetical protein